MFYRGENKKSVTQMNRYKKSNDLLLCGEQFDAWVANRVKNYNSIEDVYPVYGSHAQGAYLWDVDGNRYIDFILGYGTIILGHADPRINEPVIEEIKKGNLLSPLWKPIQVELNELLTSTIPGAEMSFLMKTGSDATSGAVRLARIFTKRNKIIRWGYNGWHDWATPRTTGVPLSTQADSILFKYNDIKSIENIFKQYPDQIACILMMPFEFEPPKLGFLNEIKALANKNGALFILDEMRSGFRMALGGAQQFFDIKADLATYSKSMSNGYPISAIVGRADILEGVGKTKMTATYFCSSHEMVAAKTTISLLQNSDIISHIWRIGTLFKEGVCKLIEEYEIEAFFRGYAPFPYIEFMAKNELERQKIKEIFYTETTKHGVLFHPNHHWYICAAHSEEDIQYTLDVVKKGFIKIKNR